MSESSTQQGLPFAPPARPTAYRQPALVQIVPIHHLPAALFSSPPRHRLTGEPLTLNRWTVALVFQLPSFFAHLSPDLIADVDTIGQAQVRGAVADRHSLQRTAFRRPHKNVPAV